MANELAINVREMFGQCDRVSDLNAKLSSIITKINTASAAQSRPIYQKLQYTTAKAQSYNVLVGNLSTIASQEWKTTINQFQPPNLQPLSDYIGELERTIRKVQHSNSELSATCTTAIELINEATRANRRAARVVGGKAATALVAAGVGTGILFDIASVFPFEVGTVNGLRATAAGTAAAGIGFGHASAAVTAHIASDFEETKTAFHKLKELVTEMQQAVQCLHRKVKVILNLVKNSMENQGSPKYPLNRSNENLGKLDHPPNLDQESQREDM